MSRMDVSIDSLGNAPVLSTFHANCGFGQAEIENTVHDKTAFTPLHWFIIFSNIPFVLRIAHSSIPLPMDVHADEKYICPNVAQQ